MGLPSLRSLRGIAGAWMPVQAEWSPGQGDGPHFGWPAPARDDPRRRIALDLLAALRAEADERGIALRGAVVQAGVLRRYDRERPLRLALRVATSAPDSHAQLLCQAAARRSAELRALADRDAVCLQTLNVGDEVRMLIPPLA